MALADDTGTPPLWARPLFIIIVIAAVTAFKAWLAGATNLVADEAYYAMWAEYLQPGYYDHPPMVALFIAGGQALGMEGELAVRLFAVGAGALVPLVLYRVTMALFADARVGALAAIWSLFTPSSALGLFLITPDAPSILFWTLALWAVAELAQSRHPRWWYAVGLFAGLGVLSKYTNLFFGAGLVLWILIHPARWGYLAQRQLWLGGLLAGLVIAPHLLWSAANDWPSFALQFGRSADLIEGQGPPANLGEFLASQVLIVGPFLFVLIVLGYGLHLLHRWRMDREGTSLLVWTSLPILVYFVIHAAGSRAEANWTQPVWPALTLLGAWAAVTIADSRGFRALGQILIGGRTIVGIALVGLIYAQASLPQVRVAGTERTDELHGWEATAARIDQLAESQNASWIGVRGNYGLTGLVRFYVGQDNGRLVLPVDDGARYGFLPKVDVPSGPALLVLNAAGDQAPQLPVSLASRARLIDIVSRDWGGAPRDFYAVFRVEAGAMAPAGP